MAAISIYGAGHLAESLLEGLAQATTAPISIFNRTLSKLDHLGEVYPHLVRVARPGELARDRSFILLIIPAVAILDLDEQLVQAVRMTGSVLVSCAGGLWLGKLEEKYPGIKAIRALPNINWRIRQGATPLKGNALVSEQEIQELAQFFSLVSTVQVLEREEDFAHLGILTSCGPGLIPEIVRQVCAAFGVTDQKERVLFYRTVRGTMDYMIQDDKSPEEVIREVATSKGGLTRVGVTALAELLPDPLAALYGCMAHRGQQRRKELAKLWPKTEGGRQNG